MKHFLEKKSESQEITNRYQLFNFKSLFSLNSGESMFGFLLNLLNMYKIRIIYRVEISYVL